MRNRILTYTIFYWWWRRRKHLIRKKQQKKRMWVRPIFVQDVRNKFGAGTNLISEMKLNDQLKYKNFFRMGPEAFEELLGLMAPLIRKVDTGREPISPGVRLGITLRFLAAGDSMASLSYLFRVGVSTVSQIIAETTRAIWQVLQPLVVTPPTCSVWEEISYGFAKAWNFPNCLGAIDGKHVAIQAPIHAGSTFYNYKGFHSIVLLAVVDHKYAFSLVDIGAQGRQSDGGVLKNSSFGRMLYRRTLDIPQAKSITPDGPLLPFVIVGDEAFPLMENLLKPYSSRGNLNFEKSIFNYRLSRARRISENAFGILIARWRIYGHNIIGKLDNIDNIIKATICLHNFIMRKHMNTSYLSPRLVDTEERGRSVPGTWRQYKSQLRPLGRVGANTYTRNASEIRDEYCRYFNEEGAVAWQWDHI